MSHSTLWVLAFVSFSGCMAADKSYYRGAVVDYLVISTNPTPRGNLMANVRMFGDLIQRAANDSADIVVFPEGGLLGSDNTIFLAVPNPNDKVIPAGNGTWDEINDKLGQMYEKFDVAKQVAVKMAKAFDYMKD